jgi:hypothetical protein
MRLVISKGIQYDADNLPGHVDAAECVPIDAWFALNRVAKVADAPSEPVEEAPKATPRRRSKAR